MAAASEQNRTPRERNCPRKRYYSGSHFSQPDPRAGAVLSEPIWPLSCAGAISAGRHSGLRCVAGRWLFGRPGLVLAHLRRDHPGGPQASAPGSAGSNRAIGSLAGPVDRVLPGSSACSGSGCAGRDNLATGAVTDAVTYPGSTELGPLLGPYPAVFVFGSSGPAYLDRIG
jgi:hypothetical protein